jgi:hypothetical protein
MPTPTANDKPLLSASIREQAAGAWHATLDVDADADLTNPVMIVIDDQTWSGWLVQSRVEHQYVRAVVVGGHGGLSTDLPVRDYSAAVAGTVTVGSVLRDWARDSGETLDETSLSAITSTALPSWHREASRASDAIQAVLDVVGATWRVLRGGTIWVGTPAWAETTVKPIELDSDWTEGVFTLADAAALEPGMTYSGERIAQVDHELVGGRLRTYARLQSRNGILERLFARLERRIDRACSWDAAATKANSGIEIECLPDDPRMRGAGLARAQMVNGLPGWTVTVPTGGRGLVTFSGARGNAPRWIGWSQGTPVTTLSFDGGSKAIARVDDDVGELIACSVTAYPVAGASPGTVTGPVITSIWYRAAHTGSWTKLAEMPGVAVEIPPTPANSGTTVKIINGCAKLLA